MSNATNRPARTRHIIACHIILIVLIAIAGLITYLPITFAQTRALANIISPSANCNLPKDPSKQSLLIVLLDRSGSLIAEPGATDPDGYSTSVTKALADLWPGKMAVIPFSGNTTRLPILGPATLSDPAQQTNLKQAIQNYPIGGNTPLAPAMQEALQLLHAQGTPPGSRVMIITDGNPAGTGNNDGTHQEQEIRSTLISTYCKQGVPVYAFGLEINPNSSNGQDADQLLTEITNGTGAAATYSNVSNPKELANNIVGLYAQWRHLSFVQISQNADGNFPVPIDSFAEHVSIITFRADNSSPITLIGPNGQRVTQGIQISAPSDRHYEVDNIDVTSPIVPGTYILHEASQSDTQVYALVESKLQLQLIAPTTKTVVEVGQSIQIEAALFNGPSQLILQQGDAFAVTDIILLVKGKQARTDTVPLKQQGSTFIGQAPQYTQAGELQIDVVASYQGVRRGISITLEIEQQVIQIPLPCDSLLCKGQQIAPPTLLLLCIVVLLILVALQRRGGKNTKIAKLAKDGILRSRGKDFKGE